ncbi:hypothetical protein Sjap_004626 [Stephania japonica]|uniref:Uncharacterized protein n=1 Tax=Stephania japonica TaxID=461633 RepID=A0AAP0K433_9MAGN
MPFRSLDLTICPLKFPTPIDLSISHPHCSISQPPPLLPRTPSPPPIVTTDSFSIYNIVEIVARPSLPAVTHFTLKENCQNSAMDVRPVAREEQ